MGRDHSRPGAIWPIPVTLPGQHVLDITQAQREAQVEPDDVLDDDWREPMAVVGGSAA